MKEKSEIFIVITAWLAYIALVFKGVANVEGFVAINVYIIKKFLDLIEEDKKKG